MAFNSVEQTKLFIKNRTDIALQFSFSGHEPSGWPAGPRNPCRLATGIPKESCRSWLSALILFGPCHFPITEHYFFCQSLARCYRRWLLPHCFEWKWFVRKGIIIRHGERYFVYFRPTIAGHVVGDVQNRITLLFICGLIFRPAMVYISRRSSIFHFFIYNQKTITSTI